MAATERQGTRHRVGGPDDFPPGRFQVREIGGREIAIIRTAKGLFAIRNACPHMSAPLCHGRVGGTMLPSGPREYVYGLEDEVVRCPWHSWEFLLSSGRAVGGITNKRLVTYPVETTDADVYVVVGAGRAPADD